MISTVKSRLNYYEMLGLTPSAAGDAIAQAFARATSVFRPHAFGGITELCVAYETLRDPAKRLAYDESLGLPPPKRNLPTISRPASAHFMHQPAVTASPSPPSAEPRPRPAPRIDRAPEPAVAPQPLRLIHDEASVGFSPIEWKRTGVVVGGLVAVAVFVGAIAGWWSGSSAADTQAPEPAVAAPSEKASPSFSELWPVPAPRAVKTHADRPRRASVSRPINRRAPQLAEFAATEAEQQLIRPPEDLADPAAADPLAPETSPAPAVAAAMPLPHKTVARTIDRIGYSCGNVASATPVEGATGVYTVICTSGQSFQAKPVNGRYRFRRLARN